jgi:PAS domain S-box-containing protein
VDALPDAALFVDSELRTVIANEALARILGASVAELEGESALARLPPDVAELRRTQLAAAARQRQPLRFEYQREDRHFMLSINPVFRRDDTFDGAAVCSVDVTELKREHARRLELEDRLSQAQRLESIGRLAGGVAHDFNNLLTSIFGFVELSLDDLERDHPVRENLESVREAGELAADLTRRLLAFSRRQIIEPRVLDLNELVERTRVLLARVIGEDIELSFRPSEPQAMVHIDPTQLNQVLMNLATNARDAMPRGGKLTLETGSVMVEEEFSRLHPGLEKGPYVQLSVSDSGVGMSPPDVEKVFEPFFTTKSRDRSAGLGLATVHGIVRQNGGAISVYSEPGVGTTFKIYLPRADATAQLPSVRPPEPIPRVEAGSSVLLVEDEGLVRQVARRVLERAGYTVLEANDGESAIALHLRVGRVALLLTDVIMPDMNGKQLLGRLRQAQPDIECVFMSGYTDDVIVHHGVLDPGVNFLEKPFSAQALIGKLEQVLASRSPAARSEP